MKTASLCQGKGSLSHNLRLFTAKNVDKTRTKDNVIFVNISQQEMYESLFDSAISEYNARQKRSDRRISTGYYEHQFGRKYSPNVVTSADKRKSFYEDVVQVGDMKDTGVGTADAETAKAVLTEYMNGFERRNPNFKVFCAVLHMDEATPHLHIDYVPIGHYSRGLPVQNGIAQALKEMGFGTGKDAIARWRQSEYEVLKSICAKHSIELSPPKKSRGSLTVGEYKKYCSDKKRLNEKLQPLREMELAADESIVAGKKQLFSTNISVSPEEFSQLENQKKAAAVQTLDNQRERDEIKRQKRLLDERETGIAEKEKAYSARKSELDEREKNIEKSEKRAEDILSEVERKMRAADEKYAHQIELNKHYNALELELLKARNESDENAGKLSEIRLAAGIPVTDNKTDIAEKCREITEENREIKNELRKELKLTAEKADEIPATEMLRDVLEKSREIEKENEKNKSVIMSLTKKFSRIKVEFAKVVLALNSLIYDKKYNRGLTGISQILAESISLFADDCFKRRGEYDDIDRSHIDGEIMENMRVLTENKQEKEHTNYYER